MAKLLLFTMLAGAMANALTVRSDPPLLIDAAGTSTSLDGQR